jgi:trehalose/maltose hydrolase-like predicted phosphorylase
MKGRDHLEDLGIHHTCEDNIRMDLREREGEGVDWIHLTQERDQWQAFVNIFGQFHKRW